MRLNLRCALLCSLCFALFLPLALATGPSPAVAQGKPAPGANQAFLYEMSENALLLGTLLDGAGNSLFPDPTCGTGFRTFGTSTCETLVQLVPDATSPTGFVIAGTTTPGIPALLVPSSTSPTAFVIAGTTTPGILTHRQAVSELQGVAAFPSWLCLSNQLITNPKSNTCTVTATGHDVVALDLSTGKPIPTSGIVWGTYAVVVQLDNAVDSPEFPAQMGAFSGTIALEPPFLRFASGFFNIGGTVAQAQACTAAPAQAPPTCIPLKGTFRLPFTMSANGHHGKPRRHQDAFYLLDNGRREPVRQDEHAVGWAAVRLELHQAPLP